MIDDLEALDATFVPLVCVICNGPLPEGSSGLCEQHEYDEQRTQRDDG